MSGSAHTHRASWQARAIPLIFGLGLVILLGHLAVLIWLIWTHTSALPNWDEWDMAYFLRLADDGQLRWQSFWRFHNEHRIFLPRMILYLLINLTGWRTQIMMMVNLGIAIGTAGLVSAAAYRSLGRRGFALVILPFILLLFSFAQFENWLFGFQTNFILAAFGMGCCIYGTTLPRSRSALGYALAFGGCLIASLSTLSGLFSWPVFLPVIWRYGRWRTALWVSATAVLYLLYFNGFPSSDRTLPTLGAFCWYALAYLGAPLGAPTPVIAILFAGGSLLLMAGNLALLYRNPQLFHRFLPWGSLGLFALAGMVVTAGGRAALGLNQALTSRYQIFSAYWWLSVLIAMALILTSAGHHNAGNSKQPPQFARIVQWSNWLLLPVLLLGLLRVDFLGLRDAQHWLQQQRANEDCAYHYDTAPNDCLAVYYPSVPRTRARLAFFEQHGLSIFRQATPQLNRLPAQGTARAVIDTLDGQPANQVSSIPRTKSTLQVQGWAIDQGAARPATAVYILIDQHATYRTSYGGARPDVAATLGNPAALNVGFRTTLPSELLPPGTHTLTIRVISADGQSYADSTQTITIEVR